MKSVIKSHFAGIPVGLLLALTSAANASLTNDLVFYAPFSATMNDVQNGGVATVHGAATRLDSGGACGGFLSLQNSTNIVPEQFIDFPDVVIGTNDFSVQIWVRSTDPRAAQAEDDVAFFSNKDWNSGWNPGWVLALGDHYWLTNRFEWNLSGLTFGRCDFDPTGRNALVFDGRWHQIVVTHARAVDAVFYVDGAFIGSADISGFAGDTVNAGLRLALGNDGTGSYAHGDGSSYNGDLDEAAIWLRVLTPQEVSEVYQNAAQGIDLYGNGGPRCMYLTNACVIGTNFVFMLQTLSNLSYTIEYNDDLGTTNWKCYDARTGDGSLVPCCLPMTNSLHRFFRARQP